MVYQALISFPKYVPKSSSIPFFYFKFCGKIFTHKKGNIAAQGESPYSQKLKFK